MNLKTVSTEQSACFLSALLNIPVAQESLLKKAVATLITSSSFKAKAQDYYFRVKEGTEKFYAPFCNLANV